MTKLQQVRQTAIQFLQETVETDPRVLRVETLEDGFYVELEALEENPTVKSRGLPTVYDRNHYEVRLDSDLEVVAYGRKPEFAQREES